MGTWNLQAFGACSRPKHTSIWPHIRAETCNPIRICLEFDPTVIWPLTHTRTHSCLGMFTLQDASTYMHDDICTRCVPLNKNMFLDSLEKSVMTQAKYWSNWSNPLQELPNTRTLQNRNTLTRELPTSELLDTTHSPVQNNYSTIVLQNRHHVT